MSDQDVAEKTPEPEANDTPAPAEAPAPKTLEQEIEEAVEAEMKGDDEAPEAKADDEQATKAGEGNAPEDDEALAGVEAPDQGADDRVLDEGELIVPVDAPPKISDKAIERAIRAGLSFSEIKQFSTEAFLDDMVARIEGAGGAGSPKDAEDVGESNDSADAMLAKIPDLDPELFDPDVVALAQGMKEIIRQQHETNASLLKSLEDLRGSQSTNWFDEKLKSVKKFTKGDADKIASVREEFDVLKAGHKATGKDVSDEALFEKAANTVLGSEMRAAKTETKTKAARDRNGQFIARVSNNGSRGKPADIDAEIAAELDKRFSLGR